MPKAKGKPKSAAARAYKSTPKTYKKAVKSALGIKGKATRTQRKAMGSAVRKGRIARGDNPNTGKAYSAKQLGLKGGAKTVYKAQDAAGKAGATKGASGGKAGTKKTGKTMNKTYASVPTGSNKRTKAVAAIAKKRGVGRAKARAIRKRRM